MRQLAATFEIGSHKKHVAIYSRPLACAMAPRHAMW